MGKIKVLHVLHAVGGVEVYLRLLTENIHASKVTNIIVRDSGEHNIYLNSLEKKIKEYEIPIQREINIWKDVSAIIKTRKIIKKEKPDLIHAHSAKGGIIARAAAMFLGIKVLHTPNAYSFLSAESTLKKRLFLQIERIFKHQSLLLATSKSEQVRGVKEVGYKPENTLLFNNSIKPIKHIEPLSIEKTWPDEYICSVGRPSFQKNIELMIDVLNELKKQKPDIHLVLMGVGFHSPNLENVKQKIKQFNLRKNITLLEWTRREDVFHIIKNSKLYISTARYEGLPYSVIEALALKKACVVTDADGNRDLVENGQNGFVIFDENVQEFKDKILRLWKDDSARKNFEENAYKKFQENFNIEKTITQLESIYWKYSNKTASNKN